MINFELECDGDGGITLIDPRKLEKLTKETAALLTIVIDVLGKTELTMDYPNKEWSVVRSRELKKLQEICSNGLMFTGLLKDGEYNVSVTFDSNSQVASTSSGFIEVTENKIIAVETGELIQNLIYPKLSLDILMDLDITSGKYLVNNNIDGDNLRLNLTSVHKDEVKTMNNAIDLSDRA
ncbi:MAG: hypothetical protein L3J59_15125 [Methylococcaceae bacterium]|nr:hypothetical protein [Methylococcaceae bacterium]